ncbi:MAG: hypothetical protein KA419_18425 [Acidobacteria bacterium]|nr:hypothetical protein [Acidobacteriota bacterium]
MAEGRSFRAWAGLGAILVAGILPCGCGGDPAGFSGDRRPFEGRWTSVQKVDGKTVIAHTLTVTSDGTRFRIDDTLETTGRKSVRLFDGTKFHEDGRSYDTELDKPEDTLEAFWLKRHGERKPGGETVCGRPVDLYEERIDTGKVVSVRSFWVDRETGYTLRMRETGELSGGRTTEKFIDCREIVYKEVSPDAFKAGP